MDVSNFFFPRTSNGFIVSITSFSFSFSIHQPNSIHKVRKAIVDARERENAINFPSFLQNNSVNGSHYLSRSLSLTLTHSLERYFNITRCIIHEMFSSVAFMPCGNSSFSHSQLHERERAKKIERKTQNWPKIFICHALNFRRAFIYFSVVRRQDFSVSFQRSSINVCLSSVIPQCAVFQS